MSIIIIFHMMWLDRHDKDLGNWWAGAFCAAMFDSLIMLTVIAALTGH